MVSSQHPEPMEQFNKLTTQQHQQQHQHPNKLPKWFCPNILHYYVLLHDVAQANEAKYAFYFPLGYDFCVIKILVVVAHCRAESIYQQMKTTYGVNACHLLQINSRSSSATEPPEQASMPNPWSQFMQRRQEYTVSKADSMVGMFLSL